MHSPFIVRNELDALIVSFASPARTLSWAVLNGGFCHARHVINHHVDGKDALFCAQPGPWLERAASRLGLQGKIVGMATAVAMRHMVQVSMIERRRPGHLLYHGRLRQRSFGGGPGFCDD